MEAYETVVPRSSRTRLRGALANPRQRPHVVTFTSSSTVQNLVAAIGARALAGIRVASIGPVTSATARALGVEVTVEASRFDENGLIEAILSKGIIEK